MANDVYVVKMPKLGETVTEGTVSRWLKSVGDRIAFDDPLLEVSTDKVDSEVPSPYDGVLMDVLVAEGETVPVGTELARLSSGEAEPAGAGPADGPTAVDTPAAPATPQSQKVRSPPNNGEGRLLSPVVRRLAAENDLDLTAIEGSGVGGRITRDDVVEAIAARPSPAVAPAGTTTPEVPIVIEAGSAVSAPTGGRDEVIPLSRIRLVTAERMLQSRKISPHVWTSVEVDLERVDRIRRQYKEPFREYEGTSLTYLAFIAKATIDALRAFPAVNSSLDMASKTMTLHRSVNLAIAVDLDEQGLMAPVIDNADALNLRGLARAIKGVGDGAKARTLSADDLTGSTFTITNPGPLGSYASAAIINQPNVAILTTDGVARRPTVVGDAIAIHHMCILGLSYDHRAFDGVTAARFLKHIRESLQERDWEAELA